jgi:hypothetical protein
MLVLISINYIVGTGVLSDSDVSGLQGNHNVGHVVSKVVCNEVQVQYVDNISITCIGIDPGSPICGRLGKFVYSSGGKHTSLVCACTNHIISSLNVHNFDFNVADILCNISFNNSACICEFNCSVCCFKVYSNIHSLHSSFGFVLLAPIEISYRQISS